MRLLRRGVLFAVLGLVSLGSCIAPGSYTVTIQFGESHRRRAVAASMMLVQVLPGTDIAPEDIRERRRGTLSGAIVHPDGYVLTSFHGIGDPKTGEVRYDMYGYMMPEGRYDGPLAASPVYQLEVVDTLPGEDIALLKIVRRSYGWIFEVLPPGHYFPFLEVDDTRHAYTTQPHYIVGFPFVSSRNSGGLPPVSIFSGSIVAVDTVNNWMHSDLRFSSGLSGAPAVSTSGVLLGIALAVQVDPRTQAHVSVIRSARAARPLLDAIR